MVRVGERIRQIRKAQKMSLEKLGAQLNLTQAAVSKLELGESKIDADLLPRLAELLGVSTSAFFSEESARKLPPAVEAAAQRAAEVAVESTRQAIREEVRAAVREELATTFAEQGRLPRATDDSTRYGVSRQEMTDTFGRMMVQQWDQLSEEKQRRILEIAEEAE